MRNEMKSAETRNVRRGRSPLHSKSVGGKIGIATTSDSEDSGVSQVAGRAPFWLIFEDQKLIKAIKNPFRLGGGGAGFGVAKMLSNEKVEIAVAGNFSPNMLEALESAGIETKKVGNINVKDALKE